MCCVRSVQYIFLCLPSEYIQIWCLTVSKRTKKSDKKQTKMFFSSAMTFNHRTCDANAAFFNNFENTNKTTQPHHMKFKDRLFFIHSFVHFGSWWTSVTIVCVKGKRNDIFFLRWIHKMHERKWRKQLIFCTIFAILFPFSVVNGSVLISFDTLCEWRIGDNLR